MATLSYWNDKKNIKKQADVVVVGGGIAGLSTLYWLKQADPNLKVVLVEKGKIGSGATGRNAGFITCGSVEHFNRMVSKHGEKEALDIWNYSEENLKLLKEHIVKNDSDYLMFENKGSCSLASSKEEFSELKKSADLMKKLKINVEVLENKDILDRLGAEGFEGGIKYIEDATINPTRLLDKLKNLSEDENHQIYEDAEVLSIENCGEEKLIKTNRLEIKSSIVILATNGYSPLLNDYFKGKIEPTRGQILATEPVPRFMESSCYANFVLDYFRQIPTGEVIIGGFRQLQKDAEKGYEDETSEVIQKALEEFLHKHIPAVRDAKITHRWTGIMGFSQDGQPLIGSLPTDSSIYFLGGFTAHGLGLSFKSAKVLVDSLMEGKAIPSYVSARRF